eukprot:158945-Amphidinium_carterae.1
MDCQFQVQGDRSGRVNINKTVPIWIREVHGDQDDVQADMQRRDRGQKRVQATTLPRLLNYCLYVNEKYARIMITEIYQQNAKKPESPPRHQHRFLLLMVQHHLTKITKIMQDAGLQPRDIKDVFDYFDEKAAQHFNRPNVRNLTEMQRQQQLERLRPQPVHQVNMMEGDKDDDYDTSQRSTQTTASASGNNMLLHRAVRSTKTKIKRNGTPYSTHSSIPSRKLVVLRICSVFPYYSVPNVFRSPSCLLTLPYRDDALLCI